MFSLPSGWLVQLVRFHSLVAGILLVGLVVWARDSRRRPHGQLPLGLRVALVLLLVGMPFSWWLSGQGLEVLTNSPPFPNAPTKFRAKAWRAMGFNLAPDEVKAERIARFGANGSSFLFIHAPGILTFNLRDQDHHLKVDYGFMPTAYANGGRTNGAILRIEIISSQGKAETLFEYYAKPVEREADRELLHAVVQLPPHQSSDRLVLSFLPGDNNDTGWDHTVIRHFSLD